MRRSLALALGCFAGCLAIAVVLANAGPRSGANALNNTIGGISWDTTGTAKPATSVVGVSLTPEFGWLSIASGEVEPTGIPLTIQVKDPTDNEVLRGELTPTSGEGGALRLEPITASGLYHVAVTSPPGVKGKVKLMIQPSPMALGLLILAGAFLVLGVGLLGWWKLAGKKAAG